ncbi:MAG: hypothetical protein Q8P86_03970 [bacterium]|nr:hypothetical protein [bacterium]
MTHNIIINAPSKCDLIVAFFLKPNPGRQSVNFTIQDPGGSRKQVEVVINSISWEDGSGDSWCFEGYCVGRPLTAKVKGWFRTSDRKGWISIDAPTAQRK